MKFAYLLLFFALICFSCQSTKIQFDRIVFYHGNTSLPPPYQERYKITLDSTEGSVSLSKGQQETTSGFSISKKNWKKIIRSAQKLSPEDKELGPSQTGAAMTSIQLFRADSSIYALTWQEQHKVSKAHKKIEKQLRALAPAVGVDLIPKEQNDQEGGEE